MTATDPAVCRKSGQMAVWAHSGGVQAIRAVEACRAEFLDGVATSNLTPPPAVSLSEMTPWLRAAGLVVDGRRQQRSYEGEQEQAHRTEPSRAARLLTFQIIGLPHASGDAAGRIAPHGGK